ncbi:MAG: hypothetical protein LBI11_07410 [Streptococcaceae bacterium]|jgi:hypothetical protein|nr:hypothetical protein [Streptococcaceae bacterium]
MKKSIAKSVVAIAATLTTVAGVSMLVANSSVTAKAATTGGVPIYRLYSPVTNEHLYTQDANEKKVLSTQAGWTYEGTGWYAPNAGTPVYRLYNPGLKNHLYTTDTNEVKTLTNGHGWQSDNNGKPLFYSGGSVAIYRMYNFALSGMHLLTTDSNEYKTLPAAGWNQEGTKLYGVAKGTPYVGNSLTGDVNIPIATAKYAASATISMTGFNSTQESKAYVALQNDPGGVIMGLRYDPFLHGVQILVENNQNPPSDGNYGVNNSNQYATKTPSVTGFTLPYLGDAALNKAYTFTVTTDGSGTFSIFVNGVFKYSVYNSKEVGTVLYPTLVTANGVSGNFTNTQYVYDGGGVKTGSSVNAPFPTGKTIYRLDANLYQ